jgi:hypothetical protein
MNHLVKNKKPFSKNPMGFGENGFLFNPMVHILNENSEVYKH